MPQYRLSTIIDLGEKTPTEVTVRGKTKTEAFASMANYLHLLMFECDVANNLWRDYCDYEDEVSFLTACREYICGDPNAQISDRIWTSLKLAVESINLEESDDPV